MLYLTNSFSVHMLPKLNCGEWEDVRFRRISSQEACSIVKGCVFRSFFGHADTVKWLESRWRMRIPVSRDLVSFRKGDRMVIATVSSKRSWETGEKPSPGFKFFLVEFV